MRAIKPIILNTLMILIIFFSIIPIQTEEIYEIASKNVEEIEIVINQEDKSLEIDFTCESCKINFRFLDNENYLKFLADQDFESRLVLNNWDTYKNKIFIPFTGSWWIIFENVDSFNKTVYLNYQLVDPPVTEDWVFWLVLIPWLGGFFLIVSIFLYRKRKN